jgi:AraC family transcriptional regulator
VQEEKISSYLCRHLEHDYGYLSTLFSSFENITIERYLILQRIERVKELLIYNEQTLSAIAFQAGYSTVQYMTSQFKQYTGMTPKEFQKLFLNRRKFIDRLC